ncbi:MOSC domain-containing protein, partial [Escherichia coli]|uniref:MOSC domain-containing protein n=1 Tax=Escherichia coli TaxID=562 RepID=UPI0021F26F6F
MPEPCFATSDTTITTGLFVYPIKGCAGTSLSVAALDTTGLRFDRRWMLVEEQTGKFLTQRDFPQMACFHPVADEDGLTVST